MENKKYVVVVDGYFVEDGKVFVSDERCSYTKEMSKDEMAEDYCDCAGIPAYYRPLCHKDIYLGIYTWNAEDIPGLLTYIGAKHGYPKGILNAYEV